MLKINTKRVLLLGLVVSLCAVSGGQAGESVELTCKNKTCDYKGTLNIGGGFWFSKVTGYCTRDKKFVEYTWKEREKPPEIIEIWNPQTGKIIELFKCPDCGDPVLPIDSLKELKCCPKCKEPTLEHHIIGCYD